VYVKSARGPSTVSLLRSWLQAALCLAQLPPISSEAGAWAAAVQEVLASVHALLGVVCQGTEDHAIVASCRHTQCRRPCGLSKLLVDQPTCSRKQRLAMSEHGSRMLGTYPAAVAPCRATVDPSVQPLAGLQAAGAAGHSMQPLLGVLGALLDTLEHFVTEPFPTPVAVPAAGFLGLAKRILDLSDASPGVETTGLHDSMAPCRRTDFSISTSSTCQLQGMPGCPLCPNIQRLRSCHVIRQHRVRLQGSGRR
jgi:hypothetical protein